MLSSQGPLLSVDKYAAAESYHSLAWAYAHVPDLHIMWLLHLCDAHQEMQSWAEAAQCAVAVAGVIMQVVFYFLSGNKKIYILICSYQCSSRNKVYFQGQTF